VNTNYDTTTKHINTSFGNMQALLEKRKNELLNEAEVIRFQKEKQLKFQKDDLEAFAEGMRTSVAFTKTLTESGTQVEIAASKKSLRARLTTLSGEKIDLVPCHDDTLKYAEANLPSLTKVIKEFGGVSGNLPDARNSYIERKTTTSSKLDEEISFTIVSVNKEGEKITRGGDTFHVHVEGPSGQLQVSTLSFGILGETFSHFVSFFSLLLRTVKMARIRHRSHPP